MAQTDRQYVIVALTVPDWPVLITKNSDKTEDIAPGT